MASPDHDHRPNRPNSGGESRVSRALTESMAVVPVDAGVYDVITASNDVYTVDVDDDSCTCPDHRIRDATCKHLHRVRHEIDADTVPGPAERETTCAHCDTTLHVPTTEADPVYCGGCTLSPGEPVRDRERGDVLIVVRSTDRRATQVAVPGTAHSVAAHPSNDEYDPADRVVEAMYPLPAGLSPEAVEARQVRRYSFPRSRLERVV